MIPGEKLAAAWREWRGSQEGRDGVKIATLGGSPDILENRLRAAFLAGAKAADDAAEINLRERLELMFFGVRR